MNGVKKYKILKKKATAEEGKTRDKLTRRDIGSSKSCKKFSSFLCCKIFNVWSQQKNLFWEMDGYSNFMVDKPVNRVRIYII